MMFDVLLLSVALTAGYLGQLVLRRMGPGQRAYGFMLLADLALAIAALTLREGSGEPGFDDARGRLIGTIAIGAAVFLVLVPPILRDWGRAAVARERLGLGRALCDLRELLQPGMGARHERELIDTILAVRAGRLDDAIAELRARRQRAEPAGLRRSLDERIALTYLYARRWDDAIAIYEGALGGYASPQLEVEVVRAYGELGRLGRAAAVVARLTTSPIAAEPVLELLIDRARLVFLAFAGRDVAVGRLLAPGGPLAAMPPDAKASWTGIARLHAGDRAGGREALERALRLAPRHGRARELAAEALARADATPAAALEPEVAAIADRMAAIERASRPDPRRTPPRLSGVRPREVPITTALVAANLGVALLVGATLGDANDLGVLIAAGANLKPAVVDGGEWWRLVSASFLHAGVVHLLINGYGLWVIGRLVEQMVGPARAFAIYVVAALAGAAASAWLGGASPSVGASGAVFGLLGAAVAELALYRRHYPDRWGRALLGTLGFLAVANVGIGVVVPIIDQAAHLGGLVGGALAGALLSRRPSFAARPLVRAIAAALAVAAGIALAYGAFAAATHDLRRTFAALPVERFEVSGLRLVAPTAFAKASDVELVAEGLGVEHFLIDRDGYHGGVAGSAPLEDRLAARVEKLLGGEAREAGYRQRAGAAVAVAGLPAPWRGLGVELAADGAGAEQHLRAMVIARLADDGELWSAIVVLPSAIADEATPMIGGMLASLGRPAGGGADRVR